MLDTRSQTSPATAAGEMMWGWALASARFADALAAGWALWSKLLRPSAHRPLWLLAPELSLSSCRRSGLEEGCTAAGPSGQGPAYASYRSPGGHAATQVILADEAG